MGLDKLRVMNIIIKGPFAKEVNLFSAELYNI